MDERRMDEQSVSDVLRGGRVLVAVAARALAAYAEDVTLPQLRALVLIGRRPQVRPVDVATELEIDSSSSTRLIERLVRKGLVDRRRDDVDRRLVYLSLTPAGEELLSAMDRHRRAGIDHLLGLLDEEDRQHLRRGLVALADAVAEAPEAREESEHWALGWQPDPDGEPVGQA